jgi:energy-coupling factor transporter ATP-binding protein EcfA2
MNMDPKEKIPVYFALGLNLQLQGLSEFERWAVILRPDLNRKNGTLFNLTVFEATRTIVERVPILLAFQESNQTGSRGRRYEGPAYVINEKLGARAEPVMAVKDFPAFYTLIPNLEGYRTMVGSLGPEDARRILAAINDMVTVGRAVKIPEWYVSAAAGNFFNTVFLRDSETFFTFHNAAPILRGLRFEQLNKISSSFKLGFKLSTFENRHELDFAFDLGKPLGNRIAVVIGKNGVGKSQTLFHFAKSLIGGSKFLTDSTGNRPHVNRLIAVTSPGETRNTFPTVRWASRIDYRRLHLSRSQWGKAESGMGSTLVQLARSDEGIKGRNRWKMFVESISVIHKPGELFVRRRDPNAETRRMMQSSDPFPITEMLEGDEDERLERWSGVCPRSDVCRFVNGKEFPLSSGQVTFIRFAAQVCLHIENGSVLLFDEPETHLHPNLITEFIRLLDRLLEMTGSVAIVATHSAYFVREVPRGQVIVLRQTDAAVNKIEAIQPRLRTLGADIGEISHFVFGDELFGRLLGKVREKIVKNQAKAAKLLNSIEEDLSVEAWMNLNRLVPEEDQE